jgi:hypothetical protein
MSVLYPTLVTFFGQEWWLPGLGSFLTFLPEIIVFFFVWAPGAKSLSFCR